MEEILIGFGSAVKSKADGSISGYLVKFSTADAPDLAGDYFDAKTDFGFEGSIKTPIYLNHRLPLDTPDGKQIIIKKKIGEGTLTKDDSGILIDAILFNRKLFEKALSALGWSSGTAEHLVDREKVGKKTYYIKTWPLGLDASLTPEPCDPTNIVSLKSYMKSMKAAEIECPSCGAMNEATATECAECGASLTAEEKSISGKSLAERLSTLISDMVDEGQQRAGILKSLAREALCDVVEVEAVLTGKTKRPPDSMLKAFARALKVSFDQLKEVAGAPSQRTIKGMFAEALAERTPNRWDVDSVFCSVIKDVATVARSSAMTDTEFDVDAKLAEIMAEYNTAMSTLVSAQIAEYVNGNSDEPFYLKSVTDLTGFFTSLNFIDLDSHSELAVSALKGIVARFHSNQAARVKAGRMLSERNRARLGTMLEQIMAAVTDCQTLLDESMPQPSDAEKRAALTAHLRAMHRTRTQLGV